MSDLSDDYEAIYLPVEWEAMWRDQACIYDGLWDY